MNSLNCVGCGRIAQTTDLVVTIKASPGPRVSVSNRDTPLWSHSAFPTVTMNVAICDSCLQAPEMRVLVELISSPYSETEMIAGGNCVILCRSRKRLFWFAGLRRRMRFWPSPEQYRCPGCNRAAMLWPAQLAPDRYVRELERVIDPGGRAMSRSRVNVAAGLARRSPLPPGDEQ
jgi:hypothetical protein